MRSKNERCAWMVVKFLIELLWAMGLFWFGVWAERDDWHNMLVDKPGTIADIRSEVLAERAEK